MTFCLQRRRFSVTLALTAVVAALSAGAAAVAPAAVAVVPGVAPDQTFTGTVDADGSQYRNHEVEASGLTVFEATLDWPGDADLDLFLKSPEGLTVTSAVTADDPEHLLWVTPGGGTYIFQVKATAGSATYELKVKSSDYEKAGGKVNFKGELAGTGDSATHQVPVGGPGLIVATLEWPTPAANLSMFLRDQSGTQVAKAVTTSRPEILAFDAPAAGNYSVLVQSASGGTTYKLRLDYPPGAAPPAYQRDYGRFATAEVSPVDMQRDSTGAWWVMDEGLACLKKYAPDLETVRRTAFTCGRVGNSDKEMSRARGIGLDRSTDELWVADTSAHRLLKLSPKGKILVETTLSDSPGGPLLSPGDVAVDDDGFAYVHDQRDRIIKVSPDGDFVSQFGTSGPGDGQLRNAMSIEFSAVGGPALYVTDARNFEVDKWTTSGTYVASYGSQGTGDGQLTKDARGIALDSRGRIYVADVGGNRVVVFAADGKPLPSLGNGLPYNEDGGLDLGYGARGLYVHGKQLAVADMWNARVLFWTLDGVDTGKRIGGKQAPWDGHLEPRGVAVDSVGNVYVSDYWHQWIEKFSPSGALLAHWGIGRGSDPGTLNLAAGIEVDEGRGYLYIANREERVVDRWLLSDGSFDKRFAMPAGPVDSKGWPRDVAVDPASGRVYAADEKNQQVVIFTAAGAVERIITTAGGAPLGVMRSVDLGPDGLLYVADGTNRRIEVYTATGDYLRGFTTADSPNGVEVTADRVLVLSFRVSEYSLTGDLIQTWGSTGGGDSEFRSPYVGIATTPDGDIVIGDTGNHRVKQFEH